MDHSWIKINYDADEDLLDRDLLVPCLKECLFFRRLTYSFTSATLKSWAGSLHHIVTDEVKIEILCDMSTVLIDWSDKQLIKALEISINENKKAEIIKCNDKILKAAMEFDTKSSSAPNKKTHRLRAKILDYLIANGQLKINFAYPKDPDQYSRQHPLYHYKKGYFVFPDDSIVLFKGSGNETNAAYAENYDDFDVYSSKRSSDLERLEQQKAKIDKGWEDDPYRKFNVIGPSEKLLNEIKQRAPKKEEYLDFIKIIKKIEDEKSSAPPKKAGFIEDDLYDYQKAVLEDWEENGRRGLVKHATGSGKTFTSIFAIKRHFQNNQVCLVVVPSNLLQEQWNEEIEKIFPECTILNAGGDFKSWKDNLYSFSRPTSNDAKRVIVAVVNTAASEEFRNAINQGDHLMMVADEVHSLGADKWSNVLNIKTGPRLGVSATPERYNDPIGTERIFEYFDRVLEPEYELKDGLGKTLVNYEYFVTECSLSDSEAHDWEEMSREINRLLAKCPVDKNGKKIPTRNVQLKRIMRSRIAKKAEMKIPLTLLILKENFEYGESWLIYCESIEQLDQLRERIVETGLPVSVYHSNLPKDTQKMTIQSFKNQGGILLSIKCLDEGIDIPSISHALVIASDQNPRQFIQRRGRVLRKDNDGSKEKAIIYDLVVSVDPQNVNYTNNLAISELKRSYEFARYSLNNIVCETKIREIARKNSIDLSSVFDDLISIEDDRENAHLSN